MYIRKFLVFFPFFAVGTDIIDYTRKGKFSIINYDFSINVDIIGISTIY